MSTVSARRFFEEIGALMQKPIFVVTSNGKTYSGILTGYTDALSVCLANAKDDSGNFFYRIFLNGNTIAHIYVAEKQFDIQELARRLEKVFPMMVKLYLEAGVIVIMDKVRVSEKGVIEGKGPAAERAQKVYEEFLKEQK
jgi:small nuclear ribonucleoprotein (snRNP)-like protein